MTIEATVYAWSTGSSDDLDLYYAADANNPSWVHIGTATAPGGGVQTMTATQSSCSGGSYDDADDLIFAVN